MVAHSELREHVSLLVRQDYPPIKSGGAVVPVLGRKAEIDPTEALVAVKAQKQLSIRAYYHKKRLGDATDLVLLRESAVKRLYTAATLLPPGFSLLVLDGWRSEATQRAIHNDFAKTAALLGKDAGKYAFDLDTTGQDRGFPTQDAPHRTGGAVDVTLLGPDRQDWPMGTAFDAISEQSATAALERDHPHEDDSIVAARLGRRALHSAMTSAGFTNYPEEWWHFDFGNSFWRFYGLLKDGPVFRTIQSLKM
jgi:D-alanyl-D-alanine dipeptidase